GTSIQAQEKKETEEETPLVFFRDIIDEVQLAFSYKFDCSEPTTGITNKVVVTIIAENPGMWRKEIRQAEESHQGKDFRVDFPLSLTRLDGIVDNIEEDIGIISRERHFIIKGVVHTTAETVSGKTIEDDFSHEITAILETKTLELKGDLKGSDTGSEGGVKYEEEGRFDYEVYLKYNELYESVVLRSEPLPIAESAELAPSPQTLGPGLVYFPKIIDSIKASFSYRFDCDRPVSEQSEEVEVTAIIENPGKWSKSLVLVPKTREKGNFTLSFPVDISYFTEVIAAIQKETGAGGGPYKLKIQAGVHTVAQTDLGMIDEVYTQPLEMKLEGNTLTFAEELSQSQAGSLGGVTIPTAPKERGWKVPWLAGLVVALVALGYLGWNQTQLKPAAVDVETEAARAKKKYKQVMVDVEGLPEVKANETVIPLSSLDDLVRIADDLVKPVLHQVEAGRHIYCIVDGAVRYQYLLGGDNKEKIGN
ncbi:MAG: DUF5305 domain-containing protein, partial [Dehalococcoidia bacterium]|nr:DUF5305 domain-containing protein [Dehalococcoidia bacterium]